MIKKSQNAGALIIALVAVHTILFIGAALLFLGRYHVAKIQADGYARNIALSALKNYYASMDTSCKERDQKFKACMAFTHKISACVGQQYYLKLCKLGFNTEGDGALSSSQKLADLSFLLADDQEAVGIDGEAKYRAKLALYQGVNQHLETKGGRIKPGRWLLREQDTNSECDEINNSLYCFIDYTKNYDILARFMLSPNMEVNAFKVEGKIFPEGVKSIFSNFLGDSILKVKVSATSAIIPRRGYFLVDISSSTTYLSHAIRGVKHMETTACDNTVKIGAAPPKCCPSLTKTPKQYSSYYGYSSNLDILGCNSASCNISQNITQMYEQDVSYACLKKDYPNGVYNPLNSYQHYIDNYTTYLPLTDTDYTNDSGAHGENLHPSEVDYPLLGKTNSKYLIDTKSTPQPLKIIFDGINAALLEFEIKAAPGDEAGLIFYDEQHVWPRLFKLSDNWKALQDITDFRPDKIDTIPDAKTNFDNIIRHGLFPGFTGTTNADGLFQPSINTNTQSAIEKALTFFAEDSEGGGIPTSDFIVLITDGLTNCIGTTCYDNFAHYAQSIDNLKAYVDATLRSRDIPLHVMLIGDYIQPNTKCHSFVDNSGVRRCYTDAEYRARPSAPYDFVEGGPHTGKRYNQLNSAELFALDHLYENKSTNNPFFRPNYDYYTMAVGTKGMFIPIRTSIKPGDSCPSNPIYVDGNIMKEDPACRTTAVQVREALEEIVRFNPYAIVDIQK